MIAEQYRAKSPKRKDTWGSLEKNRHRFPESFPSGVNSTCLIPPVVATYVKSHLPGKLLRVSLSKVFIES